MSKKQVKFASIELCALCTYYGGKNSCLSSILCENHKQFKLRKDESSKNED